MKTLPSLLLAAATAFCIAQPAKAAVVTYTFAGTGNFSGSLGGVAFTATSFSMSATADTSSIQPGSFGSGYPLIFNSVAPSIVLNTSDGILSTDILPEQGKILTVFCASGFPENLGNFYGLDYINEDGSSYGGPMVRANGAASLETAGSYSGSTYGSTYYKTTAGYLYLTLITVVESEIVSSGQGTFTIAPVSAVPEPSIAGAAILLALAGTCITSRRSRS